MTGITTADSACDEAFADRYQSDPNDPSVAQELAVWREAWALARKPYRMYTQILTMQRREEKLVGALEEIVKQYPNPNISHEKFRVHACRHAESALAAHRKQQEGEA